MVYEAVEASVEAVDAVGGLVDAVEAAGGISQRCRRTLGSSRQLPDVSSVNEALPRPKYSVRSIFEVIEAGLRG